MRQEQDTHDLIGAALRRAFREPGRSDERLEELLRRLADREAQVRRES